MITLRRFTKSDGERCLHLYRDTIRRINVDDYTPTQIAAWASNDIENDRWSASFVGRYAYVAMVGEVIVGFSDMTADGYLDRLYVSADHQRQGIATALVSRLLDDALTSGIEMVCVDVSITALPFFTKIGFADPVEQTVECRGSRFTNYRMTRVVG